MPFIQGDVQSPTENDMHTSGSSFPLQRRVLPVPGVAPCTATSTNKNESIISFFGPKIIIIFLDASKLASFVLVFFGFNLLSEGSLLVLRRGQIVRLATQDYNDVDVDMRIVATLASILSFSLTQET